VTRIPFLAATIDCGPPVGRDHLFRPTGGPKLLLSPRPVHVSRSDRAPRRRPVRQDSFFRQLPRWDGRQSTGQFSPLLFPSLPRKIVISTEAVHSHTVNSAAERSLYSAFAAAIPFSCQPPKHPNSLPDRHMRVAHEFPSTRYTGYRTKKCPGDKPGHFLSNLRRTNRDRSPATNPYIRRLCVL
jgi:hypothetical protein